MNRDKFIEYLDRPETMDTENLEQIREVLQEYPYFQTAHMLLVKTLDNLKDIRFGGQLKASAAHIGNRNILFNLLHKHHVAVRTSTGMSNEVESESETSGNFKAGPVDNKETGTEESLADKVLREVGKLKKSKEIKEEEFTDKKQQKEVRSDEDEKMKDASELPDESNVSMEGSKQDFMLIDDKADIDYTGGPESSVLPQEDDNEGKSGADLLELDKSEHIPDTPGNKPDRFSGKSAEKKKITGAEHPDNEAHSFYEWLDMFQVASLQEEEEPQMRDNNSRDDLIDRFLKEKPRIEPRSPLDNTDHPVDMSAGSANENDEFFTETLAKIYIQQKYYKKAIYAYEKLCLKYPEKYSYFANQIDEIKRFINQ